MGDRRNFLDADTSIIEKNLRFVKVCWDGERFAQICRILQYYILFSFFQSDLEENLNQFFSSGPSGNSGQSPSKTAPPREYKVVQPTPGKFENLKSLCTMYAGLGSLLVTQWMHLWFWVLLDYKRRIQKRCIVRKSSLWLNRA